VHQSFAAGILSATANTAPDGEQRASLHPIPARHTEIASSAQDGACRGKHYSDPVESASTGCASTVQPPEAIPSHTRLYRADQFGFQIHRVEALQYIL